MYTKINFKTKKALKAALAAGEKIEIFSPGGIFPAVQNGREHLEGPHYPAPHTWYAQVEMKDGFVVSIK